MAPPLFFALLGEKREAIVRLLIEANADVNAGVKNLGRNQPKTNEVTSRKTDEAENGEFSGIIRIKEHSADEGQSVRYENDGTYVYNHHQDGAMVHPKQSILRPDP